MFSNNQIKFQILNLNLIKLKIWFPSHTNHTFQVFNSHVWLVAFVSDSEGLGPHYSKCSLGISSNRII